MRQIRFLAIVFLSVLPVIAAADDSYYLRIDQPSPDSHTFITATVSGAVSCWPYPPTVTISGSKIVIAMQYRPSACIPEYIPQPLTAVIGSLPAGIYDVVGVNLIRGGDIHTKLVVRGVDPIAVYPPGASTAGGTQLDLWFDYVLDSLGGFNVIIDGLQLKEAINAGPGHIRCIAPPHPPGDVDIAVAFGNPGSSKIDTYVVRSAFRYFDPGTPPDPFLFERVLFPIRSESPGAFGSQWTTDSTIGATWMNIPLFTEFRTPPCSKCPARIDSPVQFRTVFPMDKGTSAAGTLLWAFRGTTDAMLASSRIRATNAKSSGTEIPIVRERDFRTSVDLLNIPLNRESRAMLRVWSLEDVKWPFDITAVLSGSLNLDVPLKFSTSSEDALAFASADITPLLARLDSSSAAHLRVASMFRMRHVWAMVSITNNETQEVTIVTPQ